MRELSLGYPRIIFVLTIINFYNLDNRNFSAIFVSNKKR